MAKADEDLLRLARQALEHAYAPYSQFCVGAAVRLSDGTIYKGSNKENAAYPMCLCAERVALATAFSQAPDTPITSIAITASNSTKIVNLPVSPCGACRQVLEETEKRYDTPIRVIMKGETGPVYILESASILLPFSFDANLL